MTHSFPRRVTLPATAAVMAALLLAAHAAHAVPSVPHAYTVSAAIPTGYIGTADTADLTDFEAGILPRQISPDDGAQITSITVTLGAGVFGDFSATNPTSNRFYRDQTADVSAAITVASSDPSANLLGVVLPLISRTFDLAPRRTVSQENLSGFDPSTPRHLDADHGRERPQFRHPRVFVP